MIYSLSIIYLSSSFSNMATSINIEDPISTSLSSIEHDDRGDVDVDRNGTDVDAVDVFDCCTGKAM